MRQGQEERGDQDPLAFLAGGGEMGERTRAFDWSKTPLGPVESWSPALRTVVRLILANRLPMLLWWGPHYISIYNDPYRPVLGNKHPWGLGQPVSECWKEIWHILQPLIDTPFHGGPATWDEDIFLELNRHGFVEETHFTIAYSPVPDETVPSGIGGVLATVHEITEKVVGERRMVALRDLGSHPLEAKTAEEACAVAAKTLAAHAKDVPFALLYLTDADGQHTRLAGTAGATAGEPISPPVVDLDAGHGGGWPLAEAKRKGEAQVVADLGSGFASIPPGPWSDPPSAAVVLPIRSTKAHEPAGFLVAGVSARLRLDEAYRGFLELATSQIATAIVNARVYEEEKRRAEALAELDRAKTAFFSNVSHEFRTPLTLMLGPVEDLLARGFTELSSAAKGQLEVVNRNGLRLLRLVNSLLDFSRIEAGRVRAVFQPTDLAAFTADLASNFRSACERAGLRLTVDCPKLASPVYVDRGMWEKVVLNLLSNAFKFTFDGEVAVTLRQAGDTVELCVRDTGTGIPAADLPRLFERFHRVENSRGRTHEGSGIGLALAQELVKLHGGSITATSDFGLGTTFTVTLPLRSAHLPADQIGEARSLNSSGTGADPYVEEALRWLPNEDQDDGQAEMPAHNEPLPTPYRRAEQGQSDLRPRVLVADDNADMRQYVARLLAEYYQIEAVPDGEAALAAARERPPALVLTDVMMPRLDGFGLLRGLRADPRTRDIPVIMLSARVGEESRVEGMEAGIDDYLVKPFSARELLARVGAHLQMARLRREASEALRESEERLSTVIASSPLATLVMDLDANVRLWNVAAERLFGWPADEVLGRRVPFVPLEKMPECIACRNTAQRGEVYSIRTQRLRRDGSLVEVNLTAAPLRERGRQMAEILVLVEDITERNRSERQREALVSQLQEQDRRKDEFLATLAHELRNPLAPLRNGLQILRMSRERAAQEQARDMMDRQLGQMVRLIDDLLDVSRISRDKLELRRERVEVAAAVNSAVETSRPLIEAGGHELILDVPAEPLFVNADMARLSQVFSNLLNNAAKYTERGGHIRLAVERKGSDVVVSVKDDGVGIPAPMLPKIFDMFTQVDRSIERSQGGLGIGLTLVRRLVQMHEGTVEARSDGHGLGSEFVVRLPVALSLVQEVDPPATAGEPTLPSARRRILVADDNVDGASSLAMLLKIKGNEVRTANDGLQAVETAAVFRPDVILLDIGMPKLNGCDACRRIREEPWGKGVVLVALTGWGQDEDRRRSREAGFDFHMVKPVDPAALDTLLAGLQATTG